MKQLRVWWQNLSRQTQATLLAVFVAVAALLPRLPGLDIFLTADEPKSWFGRSIQFLNAIAQGNWAATFDSPAPGVTTMWAGSLGLLLEYARLGFPGDSLTDFLAVVPFDPLDPAILPLIRLPGVLLAALMTVLTYLWGRAFLGQPVALLTALLVALDPFLLSLTRILGHDGLVTLFMWLSLVAFLKAVQPLETAPSTPIQNPKPVDRRFILLSGALGGLAFLSKYPSLFLGAFITLALLILHLREHKSRLQAIKLWLIELCLWSAAAGVVVVALWPAMWVDPFGRIMAILGDALRASGSPHPKGSFFFGQPVADPGATYYAIVTLFKSTPVLWLGWLLLLIAAIVRISQRGNAQTGWNSTILILLAFALLYGLLITIGGKKQDRYILPIFPALAALAALGYTHFMTILMSPMAWRASSKASMDHLQPSPRYFYGLSATLVVIQAIMVLPYHPYYFTYYSPILGGGRAAAKTIIVGWGEGMDEAARWLNTQSDAQNINAVAWYSTTFEPYFGGNAIYKIDEEKISRTPKPGLAADYVIFYINQLQRELPTSGALQFFWATPPVHTVTLNGLAYAWIVPSISLQRIIANEARLVGQAELLGFNLFDMTGQPLHSLSADQPAALQLYWEWRGKAPDEPIHLSVIDPTGQSWGLGRSSGTQARFPFEQWREGMIAHDDFILEILPGTPPGDYYLKAWIDRPATGELVGVFPLPFEDGHLIVDRPGSPPMSSDLSLSVALDAPLAGAQIKLLGLERAEDINNPWQPGENRSITLFWQARQTISKSYPIKLALIDTANTVRAEWMGLPVGGRFPTDQWQAGDVIRDPLNLTLPAYAPPGDYRLTARLGPTPPIELLSLSVGGRPRLFEPPPLDIPVKARFGENIELLGLRHAPTTDQETILIEPGQPLTFDLVWRADDLIETDYTLTVQLLDNQQQVRAQRDSMPLAGAAPTSSWAVGEILPETITLVIPAEIGDGPYNLLIAFYHFETGARLLLPDGLDHFTIPVKLVSLNK